MERGARSVGVEQEVDIIAGFINDIGSPLSPRRRQETEGMILPILGGSQKRSQHVLRWRTGTQCSATRSFLEAAAGSPGTHSPSDPADSNKWIPRRGHPIPPDQPPVPTPAAASLCGPPAAGGREWGADRWPPLSTGLRVSERAKGGCQCLMFVRSTQVCTCRQAHAFVSIASHLNVYIHIHIYIHIHRCEDIQIFRYGGIGIGTVYVHVET